MTSLTHKHADVYAQVNEEHAVRVTYDPETGVDLFAFRAVLAAMLGVQSHVWLTLDDIHHATTPKSDTEAAAIADARKGGAA